MKYLDFYEFQLNEIGEGTATPLKWKFNKVGVDHTKYFSYLAKSVKSKLEYIIIFQEVERDSEIYDLSFSVKDWETEGSDEDNQFNAITNAGDMYSLMATLIQIVIDFVKENDPFTLLFSGTPDKDEDDEKYEMTKRAKLYLMFVEKNIKKYFPNAKIKRQQYSSIQVIFKNSM